MHNIIRTHAQRCKDTLTTRVMTHSYLRQDTHTYLPPSSEPLLTRIRSGGSSLSPSLSTRGGGPSSSEEASEESSTSLDCSSSLLLPPHRPSSRPPHCRPYACATHLNPHSSWSSLGLQGLQSTQNIRTTIWLNVRVCPYSFLHVSLRCFSVCAHPCIHVSLCGLTCVLILKIKCD